MIPMGSRPRPAWDAVRLAALLPENLPRVLAGMGFDQRIASLRRGDIRWWPPEYQAFRRWRARYAASESVAGRGLRAGAFTAEAVADLDAQDARDMAPVAEANRLRRDAEVLVMLRWNLPVARRLAGLDGRWPPGACTVIYLDSHTGEWRSLDNAQRGECLIALGQLMWAEPRFGRAALRIARLCGLRRIPDLPPPRPIGEVLRDAVEALHARRVAAMAAGMGQDG